MKLYAFAVFAAVTVCAATPWDGPSADSVVLIGGFIGLGISAFSFGALHPAWPWMGVLIPGTYWILADLAESVCRATSCYDAAARRFGEPPDWGQMIYALGLLELWVIGLLSRTGYEVARLIQRWISRRIAGAKFGPRGASS